MNEGALEGLDNRTLHETIKAMLINTIKDCIKYENWMDPDMTEINNLLVKENKTEDDLRRIKNAQDRLRNSLHFAQISENSLYTLLYQILLSDNIKECFKQDMPVLYENLYYMIDMEEEIAESLTYIFAELYEEPNYQSICKIISKNIEEFIDNAEEYIEDIQEHELYDQFVSLREKRKEISFALYNYKNLSALIENRKNTLRERLNYSTSAWLKGRNQDSNSLEDILTMYEEDEYIKRIKKWKNCCSSKTNIGVWRCNNARNKSKAKWNNKKIR